MTALAIIDETVIVLRAMEFVSRSQGKKEVVPTGDPMDRVLKDDQRLKASKKQH
jgi:hypothetical protein